MSAARAPSPPQSRSRDALWDASTASALSVVERLTPGHHSCQRPMSWNKAHTRSDGCGNRQCVVKWNGADSPGLATAWVWEPEARGSVPSSSGGIVMRQPAAPSAAGDARMEAVEGRGERSDAVCVEELLPQLLVEPAGRLVRCDDLVDRGVGVEDRRRQTREESPQE